MWVIVRLFNAWFEQFLTPILQSGQTVILDNASFHKSKKISELAEGVGDEILYLPAYSSDFNESEHQWFPIKNRARKNIPLKEKLYSLAKEFPEIIFETRGEGLLMGMAFKTPIADEVVNQCLDKWLILTKVLNNRVM